MRTVHLLIKPASGLCDLRCRYCFCHDITEKREQSSYGMMDEPALEAVIRQALAAVTGVCHVAFQGRKPTLGRLGFFQKSGGAASLPQCQPCSGPLFHPDQWNALRWRMGGFLPGQPFFGGHLSGWRKEYARLQPYRPKGESTYNRVIQAIQLLEEPGGGLQYF